MSWVLTVASPAEREGPAMHPEHDRLQSRPGRATSLTAAAAAAAVGLCPGSERQRCLYVEEKAGPAAPIWTQHQVAGIGTDQIGFFSRTAR